MEQSGGYVLNGRVSGMLAVTRALGDHMLKGPFGFKLLLYFACHSFFLSRLSDVGTVLS